MPRWTVNDIPNQTGRVAIITGANSGLGYESAVALARKQAQVIIASRDQTKGQAALKKLIQQVPNAKAEFMTLDLASLASIRAFATEFNSRYSRLDLLLNNAGVMAIPRKETVDGFETQFGVNHLGHFALTGLLLSTILNTPNSRIVNTTSGAQSIGRIHFEDLQLKRGYTRYGAYGQSKLANVLFTFELQRKLQAAAATTISLCAHPGYASTSLQHTSANTSNSLLENVFYSFANPIVAQSAEMGALPQLYAATASGVKGGEMYGPRFYTRGYPTLAVATPRAYDEADARRLWQVSEELTGVHYSFEKQPSMAEK